MIFSGISRNLDLNSCIFQTQNVLRRSLQSLVDGRNVFSLSRSNFPQFQFIRGFRPKKFLDNRRSLAPVEEIPGASRGFRDLFRPFCFTIFVSACSFTGAAIWQYEHLRTEFKQQSNKINQFYGKAGSYRHTLNVWWNELLPEQKVVASIVAINIGVFLLWRVVPLQRIMLTYFTSSPISGAPCRSMLLSAFSHYSLFHLFANMYVLWSFAPVVSHILGLEQFVATYLSAAVISGFTSYVYKTFRRSRVPSLGASGAIMGLIGIVCVHRPNSQLSVAFVDQIFPHSFSADSAMKFLILLDFTGILLGWRFFDHAAHLGGMLFGIWYVKYGHRLIWHNREPMMMKWHELRGKPK